MNKIIYNVSDREKCYKFLIFFEKFLTSAEPNPKTDTMYWTLKQIGHYIGLAKHINKFGEAFKNFQNIKALLKGKMIFCISLKELYDISFDLLKILDTFIDHLIFLCKINVIKNNKITLLNRLSGIIWFIDITRTFRNNYGNYNDNNALTLKEKCKIIKCIFDYLVLFNYAWDEELLPKWLFCIFGMISSALGIYTSYLLE